MATKKEIMAQLDELGIDYQPRATKADLEALLPSDHLSLVVTSQGLNVREAPSKGSRVLRIAHRGDVLEAVEPLESGWYALEDGGHVMAEYVERL